MKKMKKCNRLFNAIFALSVCAVLSASSAYAAGGVPASSYAGYGYTHGIVPVKNEVGGASIHDSDMMRYEKNSRIRENDYKHYEQEKNGTEGEPVKNYAAPNNDLHSELENINKRIDDLYKLVNKETPDA